MDRGREVLPGSIAGTVVLDRFSGNLAPVPFARLSVSPSTRLAMADEDGAFQITRLAPTRYALRSVLDENGDGRIDRGAWRDVQLDRLNGRAGFAIIDDLELLPTLAAAGTVVAAVEGGDASNSRIVATHISTDGARAVEQTAVADEVGNYQLLHSLSGGRIEVVAVSADGRHRSAAAAVDLPASDDNNLRVITIPTLELQPPQSAPLLLRTFPAVDSATVTLRSARNPNGIVVDAAGRGAELVIDIDGQDAGPFDVLVVADEGSGSLSHVVAGGELVWDLVLALDDPCALTPNRDCDGDGKRSLPYNDNGQLPSTHLAMPAHSSVFAQQPPTAAAVRHRPLTHTCSCSQRSPSSHAPSAAMML